MRYLEKHIARLLLNNDCVIVPGFGGFMAHNIPAKYDEENCIFIPPMRIVGFNPQLTMNDSLLAQEYVNTYDISFPEALKQIATDVESLKRHIEEEHIYELLRIGKFVINGSTLEFIPEETGVITPALYGLDAINIRPVANTVEEKAIATAKVSETVEQTETEEDVADETLSVHIPLRYIKHVAAACIAIIFMLTMPAKLGDSSKPNINQSAINANWFYEIMPKDITSGTPDKLNDMAATEAAEESATNTEANTANNAENKEVATTTNNTNEQTSERYFSIVLASRVAKKNAEEYVSKLHRKGMKEARVYIGANGHVKVIYRKFNTREEANKAKNMLTDNIEFEGSWITEIK
ncbi:SPOR domain-containing protein [Leyella stercorea]|uniref:HU domain-containing protein n=1 Tax=Leyella stercorea TaxID=363265 RepID=UPI00242BC99E|nr:SPOR domain-containing protein [Leyella stercorea]